MKEVGKLSIIDPHDSFEFARRMEVLLTVPQIRKLWQDWALDYVQQFDYPAIVDQYEQLYKDALKKHKDSVGLFKKRSKSAKVKTK
jgi:hypothetical protein